MLLEWFGPGNAQKTKKTTFGELSLSIMKDLPQAVGRSQVFLPGQTKNNYNAHTCEGAAHARVDEHNGAISGSETREI